MRCGNWRIGTYAVSQSVCEVDSSMIHTATFHILYGDGVEREQLIARSVSVERVHSVYMGTTKYRYKCKCVLARTSGFPYVHFAAVLTQYRTLCAAFSDVRTTLDTRDLKIADYCHEYWNRAASRFVGSSEYRHWDRTEYTSDLPAQGGGEADHEQE